MKEPAKEVVAIPEYPAPVVLWEDIGVKRSLIKKDDGRDLFFGYHFLAAKGNAKAQATLAHMYVNGWVSVPDSFSIARDWARRSSEGNCGYGSWVLSWIEFEDENLRSGLDHMLSAVGHEFPPAFYQLGLISIAGTIIAKDYSVGESCLRKASQLGHFPSKYALNLFRRSGAFGIQQQLVGYAALPGDTLFPIFLRSMLAKKNTVHGLVYRRAGVLGRQWASAAGVNMPEPHLSDRHKDLVDFLRSSPKR